MDREPENINVNLSIAFTSLSGKLILIDLSFPVLVPPDDYTFSRILNDFSYRLNNDAINPKISRQDIQKVANEFKINLKLGKDQIRVNKLGTNRFYSVWHSLARAEIQEGDTFYVILGLQPLCSSLPGNPVPLSILRKSNEVSSILTRGYFGSRGLPGEPCVPPPLPKFDLDSGLGGKPVAEPDLDNGKKQQDQKNNS